MITEINLKNFKSLTDLSCNFETKKNTANHLVMIYGSNGSGKSTLIESVKFLQQSIHTMDLKKFLNELLVVSDNEMPFSRMQNTLANANPFNTDALYRLYKTKGGYEPIQFSIHFMLKGKKGSYFLELGKDGIASEKLEYNLNIRKTTLYHADRSGIRFSKALFGNNQVGKQIKNDIRINFGMHSVLSIVAGERNNFTEEKLKESVNSSLYEVIDYFNQIVLDLNEKKGRTNQDLQPQIPVSLNISEGFVNQNDRKWLKKQEKVLNYFLRKLYSDISSVYYEIQGDENPSRYELILRKNIGGQLRNVSFKDESTGTSKILQILPYLLEAVQGKTVLVDEFDTGIHDLMADAILKNISSAISGQLILTTHNTLFMNTIPVKHIYLLDSDNRGIKELIPLNEYTIQKGYNIRDRYLKGEYDAVPYTGTIDFQDILEMIHEEE